MKILSSDHFWIYSVPLFFHEQDWMILSHHQGTWTKKIDKMTIPRTCLFRQLGRLLQTQNIDHCRIKSKTLNILGDLFFQQISLQQCTHFENQTVFFEYQTKSNTVICDKKQIHFLKISDKKQTQPCKKSDNFNCFSAAFKLHRKRFFYLLTIWR